MYWKAEVFDLLKFSQNLISGNIRIVANALEKHNHRSEHWVVVSGTDIETNGDDVFERTENQSIFIPAGIVYRQENKGKHALTIIEVQTGSYLQ